MWSFVRHFKAISEFELELQSGNAQFRSKLVIFCPVWPWNLMDDLKITRPPLRYYAKLCASFQTYQWSQTGVTVQKRSIRVKISDFLFCMTLEFDGWPWKTIEHIFYTTSSFVHHFKSISEVKLELQSGNAQFGSKSAIFLSCMTLEFDGWPWKTIEHLFYATSSFVHHFIAIGEFRLELQSGNAQFGSKLTFFLSCVTLKFDGWPWKTIGHLFYAASSFVHHFVAIGEFKLELQSRNSQFGSNSTIFLAVWPWNLMDDLENQ